MLLSIRSITLPGASAGYHFTLIRIFPELELAQSEKPLAQALFSLSLGMGAMITYGSYISKKDNVVISAGYVCLFDTLIAILSGIMIFPALFAMNLDPAGGPGLVFIVLPTIFAKMPGGYFFGAGFFLLLTVAALTSTISLLEVATAYLVDEFKWKRKKAVFLMAGLACIFGIPSALSFGGVDWLSKLPVLELAF